MALRLPWHIKPHDPKPIKLVKKAAFSVNLTANGGFFVWSVFGAHTTLEFGAGFVALAVALNEVGHLLEEWLNEG